MSKEKTKIMKYKTTNGIPICPYCKKPTIRSGGGGTKTLAYFAPVYDKEGKNTNPDKNIITYSWRCNECGKDYKTKGNSIDGFDYKL